MAKEGGADYSIPANGDLTIGYGTGGGQPRQYYLRPGQDFDVGFLKLFVSTDWVDFSNIKQLSPFEDAFRAGKPFEGTKANIWGTVCIPVIQHRRGA